MGIILKGLPRCQHGLHFNGDMIDMHCIWEGQGLIFAEISPKSFIVY